LRADALVAMAEQAWATGVIGWGSAAGAQDGTGATPGDGSREGPVLHLARTRGAAVMVTVPYTSLIGADDAPGELAGHGPISADVARRIAAHGTWRRVLTDPASGRVLEVSRTRYRPP